MVDTRASLGGAGGEAPGGAPALARVLIDRCLRQGVQMTPGQTQRTSQKRTVFFGQCQVVRGLVYVGVGGGLTSGGHSHTDMCISHWSR